MAKFNIAARCRSFKYAFKGIWWMLKSQHNFWIHILAAILVVVFGFFYELSVAEWLFVIFAIGFVFSAEAFNTAIEGLVDLASPDYNEKAGKIKDIAAGAVLISAITAALIGLLIFLPKIF